MNSVQPALLEHILERMPVGVAILDCPSLRILYMNTYLQSLLPSSWSTQSLIGHSLRDIVPDEEYKIVEPFIQEVCLRVERERSPISLMRGSWKHEVEHTGIYLLNVSQAHYQAVYLKSKTL